MKRNNIFIVLMVLIILGWIYVKYSKQDSVNVLPVNTVIQGEEFHKNTLEHDLGSFDMLIGGKRSPLDKQDQDFYSRLINLYAKEGYPAVSSLEQSAVEKALPQDVSGRLFISTKEKNTPMSVRSFDFIEGQLGTTSVILNNSQQISYSPDGRYYAIIVDNAFDVENGQRVEVRDSQSNLMLFSINSGYRESDINWSDDGSKIAYHRARTRDVGYEETESLRVFGNEVVVFDVKNQTEVMVIPEAARARWIYGDQYLLYFKPDGLYVRTMANGEEQKIVSIEDDREMLLSSGLDVSFDDKFIVWTTGHVGSLDILVLDKIEDQFKVSLGWRSYPQDREFYWPVFAPESYHFALQAVDKNTDELFDRTNARIDIYGLSSSTPYVSAPLNQFDFRNTFTDDWIQL